MAAVWSSAKLVELDFSGIEAKLLGWFMRSPEYIRLAALGVHAYVASHVLKRPANLSWSDTDLASYFAEIKNSDELPEQTAYAQSKRIVHGSGYGMTDHGMVRNYPQLFPTLSAATKVQQTYFAVAPGLPQFHTAVRHTAYDQKYLGGAGVYTYDAVKRKVSGHPFGYQHWFWSVVAYERLTLSQKLWREKRKMPLLEINGNWFGVTLGEDAKAVVAFYPQSSARGVLTEACFPLFDPDDPLASTCYIGDVYYGDTPLRAPIHDSLLMEVPTRKVDLVLERASYAMQRPIVQMPCSPEWGIGQYLTVGVDAKVGSDWGSMKKVKLPQWAPMVSQEVTSDVPYTPAEVGDEEDVMDLETVA